MADDTLERTETLHMGCLLQGALAVPSGVAAGGVLVFPSALGLGKQAFATLRALAARGFLALAVDM